MKTKELIEKLKEMPQDAEVYHLWDGELRTGINVVYESKGGDVVTADNDMVCYTDSSRPVGAPSEAENRYWKTPD
nr:hypothetical protein 42 [Balneolaceae bacterium]